MSHQQIYRFFDNLDFNCTPTIKSADPVPFFVIDNFLPPNIFDIIVSESNTIPADQWTVFKNELSYREECRNFVDAPHLQSLALSFQSSAFLKWLEAVTGQEKLIADPHMRGGGLCRVPPGSSLGLHNDFNWNEQIRLTRRVNLILYVNEVWEESWGGDLEFWDFDVTECRIKISPAPNRLAVWVYDEQLIHGHPHPLNTPEGVYRKNFIQFYYSSNATHETPPHRSQFYNG